MQEDHLIPGTLVKRTGSDKDKKSRDKTDFVKKNASIQSSLSRHSEARSRSNSTKSKLNPVLQNNNVAHKIGSDQHKARENNSSRDAVDRRSSLEQNHFKVANTNASVPNKVSAKLSGELSNDVSNIKVSRMS